MEKIAAVFPRTFELLASDQDAIVRDFVEACPPVDISRLENARQFHDFLRARWRREPPKPPHLPDVAACEFAFAQARIGAPGSRARPAATPATSAATRARCSCVAPTMSGRSSSPARWTWRSIKRDTLLAIAIPPGAEHPRIFELASRRVRCARRARPIGPIAHVLGATPELDELIGELAEHGLIEVRR